MTHKLHLLAISLYVTSITLIVDFFTGGEARINFTHKKQNKEKQQHRSKDMFNWVLSSFNINLTWNLGSFNDPGDDTMIVVKLIILTLPSAYNLEMLKFIKCYENVYRFSLQFQTSHDVNLSSLKR